MQAASVLDGRVGAGCLLGLLAAAALATVAPAQARADEGPAPVIESESSTAVSGTDATLEARVSGGDRYTGYEFQVDTTGEFSFKGPVCPFELPGYVACEAIQASGEEMPGGVLPVPRYIPASAEAQTVSLDLAAIGVHLQPETTYHYRLVADSGSTVEGLDQTFTTASGSSVSKPQAPPAIESESVAHISGTDAVLEASIDGRDGYTEYEFQVDESGSYDYEVPLCAFPFPHTAQCEFLDADGEHMPGGVEPVPEGLPASPGRQGVTLDLVSIGVVLAPGSTYHYRLIAEGYGGWAVGPDQTFTTLADPAVPISEPPQESSGPTPTPSEPTPTPGGSTPTPIAEGPGPISIAGGPAFAPIPSEPAVPPPPESSEDLGSDSRGADVGNQSGPTGTGTAKETAETHAGPRGRAARKLARALGVCRRQARTGRRGCVQEARLAYRRRLARIAARSRGRGGDQRGIVKARVTTAPLRPASVARARNR